jgi:hypothetical protein
MIGRKAEVSWGLLQCVEVSVERAILKMPLGHVAELRHKQDDLALCDNCGTYIYLPPDEMVVSPMPPARRGRGLARTPLTHV